MSQSDKSGASKKGKHKVKMMNAKPETARCIKAVARNDGQKNVLRAIDQNTITIVEGKPGTGKAQPLTSLVLTPTGFKAMGEIRVGDLVSTPDGGTARVGGVYPQGVKDIYRVTFSDGGSAECCLEHLWKVTRSNVPKGHAWRRGRVVDTRYLIDNLLRPDGSPRFSIEMPEPLHMEPRDVLLDPYVMGVLIGDGCLTQAVSFASADAEVVAEVKTRLPAGYVAKYRSQYDYGIVKEVRGGGGDVIDAVRHYCLDGLESHEKFIPRDYLHNSVDARLELLRGLMDSDGWVDRKTGQPWFSTTSETLAMQFEWLVKSLGGMCSLRRKKKWYTYDGERKVGKDAFEGVVRINRTDIFKLSRKLSLVRLREKYVAKRSIVSVEKVGREEAQCIYVESDDHLYVTNDFIVTHNTYLAVSYGLQMLMRGKFKRLIITRPYVDAGEHLGFLPGSVEDKTAPYLMPIYDTLGDHLTNADVQEMLDDGRIMIVAVAHMRGLTFRGAYVVCDEAQNLTRKQFHMLLTRVGDDSKVVVTGDVNQPDIGKASGLADAMGRLQGVEGLEVVRMDASCIVRHPIVAAIDQRYTEGQ